MHEVEVKAVLNNKEALLQALSKLGCEFGEEVSQDDTVYARVVGTLEDFLSNTDFLRLRVQNSGQILFTLKHHPGRIVSLTSAPLEHELEVSSRETMEKILELMGYKEAVRIKKIRIKTHCEKWEICIDEVEGLGSFVEIEELLDANDTQQAVRERMEAFLATVGIGAEDLLNNRYDVMLMQKQGKN